MTLDQRCPECGAEVAVAAGGYAALHEATQRRLPERLSMASDVLTLTGVGHMVVGVLAAASAVFGAWYEGSIAMLAVATLLACGELCVWVMALRGVPRIEWWRRPAGAAVLGAIGTLSVCLLALAGVLLLRDGPRADAAWWWFLCIATAAHLVRAAAAAHMAHHLGFALGQGAVAREAARRPWLLLAVGIVLLPVGLGPGVIVLLEARLARSLARGVRASARAGGVELVAPAP